MTAKPLRVIVRPMVDHQKRYAAAIARIYDLSNIEKWIGGDRPGQKPVHVFDFENGVRLIISREAFPGKPPRIHVSASLNDLTTMPTAATMDAVAARRKFREVVGDVFLELTGRPIPYGSFMCWSDKGVPHWSIPDEAIA
jgi:hypothetical protein